MDSSDALRAPVRPDDIAATPAMEMEMEMAIKSNKNQDMEEKQINSWCTEL